MVQGPSYAAIAVLSDPEASVAQQLNVTKKLKNLIIGQDQRKESAVKNGIIRPLAEILSTAAKVTGKRKMGPSPVAPAYPSHEWNLEDELRLQAALVLASLASSGLAIVFPLCSAEIPHILVQALATDLPPRLTVAILQALKALAVHCSATPQEGSPKPDFWSRVFNEDTAESFDDILRHATPGTESWQQATLVTSIIALLPESATNSKAVLISFGILDTLASLLVSYAIQHMIIWPHRIATSVLSPPPDFIPIILAAVGAIIQGSKYRTHRFIHSPSIRDLFSHTDIDGSEPRNIFGSRPGFATPHEHLLPPLHIPSYRSVSHHQPASSNFPALKSMQSCKPSYRPLEYSQLGGDIDHSNAVCSLLLVFARLYQGLDRLAALRLLGLVVLAIGAESAVSSHRAEHLQKLRERERQLAFLAVPLAVNLIQYAHEGKANDAAAEPHDLNEIREQACIALALLIDGSTELQIAAVDAGAIKHVCPILKKSFDHIPLSKPMWSSRHTVNDPNAPETSRLGPHDLPAEIRHAMRCRQSALEALSALAAKEDIHRKAIVDSGVISSIIASLKPFQDSVPTRTMSPKDGNTTAVILSACHAARSMSRSVSVLRTSLIDGGIAKPLIELLNHPSVEVQIAATDVCCNLLPDFSPMREDLSEHNVIRTLTEHARSSSPELRLTSLWALKHLMYGCPKEVKITTLEELGTGWLVGIIRGEQRESGMLSGGGVSVGLSSANAAGEQIDLLNPSSMDIDDLGITAEDDMTADDDGDDEDGEVLYDDASNTHYQASQIRSTLNPPLPAFNSKKFLSSIRDMEQNDAYTAKRDEAAIQQQALDFIRNLINGEDCAAMSDYLMNQIGSARVYELLTAKLSPLPRSVGGHQVFNAPELVLSTIHVIIHLANSPRHRQMLIAQKPLLQAMLPHFRHQDHRVRVMSVWAVNSLTWIEEDGDRQDAHYRAKELKLLGIEQAVRGLQTDSNLDVRERVKTAIRHFETL